MVFTRGVSCCLTLLLVLMLLFQSCFALWSPRLWESWSVCFSCICMFILHALCLSQTWANVPMKPSGFGGNMSICCMSKIVFGIVRYNALHYITKINWYSYLQDLLILGLFNVLMMVVLLLLRDGTLFNYTDGHLSCRAGNSASLNMLVTQPRDATAFGSVIALSSFELSCPCQCCR